MPGTVVAVCVSAKKGIRKRAVPQARLVQDFGLEGDAHAGPWHRQVSLLALESIEKMRAKGLSVHPGSFAENITTSGLDLPSFAIGQRIRIGDEVVLEVTQIGKECHNRCAIYFLAGDCVMPSEGIFARVLRGGDVKPGAPVSLAVQRSSFGPGEWTGALGDLGTMVPILLALAMTGALSLKPALVGIGLTYILAGAYFGLPMPVQPLKAAAAIALAQGVGPGVLAASALWMGGIFLLLGASGRAETVNRLFTRTVIRGIQLGVGLFLVQSSLRIIAEPAVGASWVPAGWAATLPSSGDFLTAFWVLVLPQLPMTLGNSVAATAQLAKEYFGSRAFRVGPASLAVSIGAANLAAGLIGGMPVCHGSGGLTAHYRLGARTAGAAWIIGLGFLALAAIPGTGAVGILRSLPPWSLAVLLGYVGLRHALLAFEPGSGRIIALAMGLTALSSQSLTLALGVGMVWEGWRAASDGRLRENPSEQTQRVPAEA